MAAFARTMAQRFAISDALHDLVQRLGAVLELDGAGVSLEESGRLRFVTANDERSSNLERVQEREQDGPCIDAWRTGEVVAIPDLRRSRGRWPAYEPVALAGGVVAVAGIPMRTNGETIGALDLYAGEPRAWSDEDIMAAGVLADVATGFVVNASELDRQRRLNEQLQAALDSRVVIEQAKGIMAAQRNVSIDAAFELLRNHARNHNSSLRAVAEAVVNLGLRP
jgi:GAF domain-containing protein